MRGRGYAVGRGCWVGVGDASKHCQTSPELMLGLPPRCWVHLVGVSGGEKI